MPCLNKILQTGNIHCCTCTYNLQNRHYFFAFFRRARASARRARSARHAQQEGHGKNNACTPTIVHAVPPLDTPSNHQPITAFDRSGAKRPVMFREPRTERPPAKMKDVGQSDENSCQHRRIAELFYLIYGVVKKQEGNINSKLPQHKPQSCGKKGSKDK